MDPEAINEAPVGGQDGAIHRIAAEHAETPGGLLPLLHAVQREIGYVPPSAVPIIAEALNLSRAEVHGVVSFYHFFRTEPGGRKVVYVCRAEACQSMGSRGLEAHAREKLGVDWHQTTSDGKYSLEPVYCLGNCACAPAVMIDETVYGRVTPARFDELIG
jgi:formate dehydrogenase subunit gamma